jgi:Retron-type reverse transcriptase
MTPLRAAHWRKMVWDVCAHGIPAGARAPAAAGQSFSHFVFLRDRRMRASSKHRASRVMSEECAMEFLEGLVNPGVWDEYYTYCAGRDFITKTELKSMRRKIDREEYLPTVTRWLEERHFPPAHRKVISKMGTDKKRIVYTYDAGESLLLKIVAHHLHEYDGLFAPNLFSFRTDSGVRRAMTYLREQPDMSKRYVYKADIHDYFNSVDPGRILPMVRDALGGEPLLCGLIEELLTNPYVYRDDTLVEERKGIMAGVPVSSFLANLYLSEMDWHMHREGVLYARYADDIIVFADSAEELARHKAYILDTLERLGLTINPKKEFESLPGEPWTFLGVTCRDGVYDVSEASVEKMKGKMHRKARRFRRLITRGKKPLSEEDAIRRFIRVFNIKFYENSSDNELTWARWFFPIITTSGSLAVLDRYMVQCARYIRTGKYSKANYRLRYETIKSYGFRSLVHEYYRGQNGAKETVGRADPAGHPDGDPEEER